MICKLEHIKTIMTDSTMGEQRQGQTQTNIPPTNSYRMSQTSVAGEIRGFAATFFVRNKIEFQGGMFCCYLIIYLKKCSGSSSSGTSVATDPLEFVRFIRLFDDIIFPHFFRMLFLFPPIFQIFLYISFPSLDNKTNK